MQQQQQFLIKLNILCVDIQYADSPLPDTVLVFVCRCWFFTAGRAQVLFLTTATAFALSMELSHH